MFDSKFEIPLIRILFFGRGVGLALSPPSLVGVRLPFGRSGRRFQEGGFEQCWRQRNAHLEVERRFSAPRFILLANRPPNAPQNHALPRACPRCFESLRARAFRPRAVAPLLGRGPASLREVRTPVPGGGLRAMLETAKCAPRSRKTLLRPEIYSSRQQTAKCSAKPCVASCLPTVLRKLQKVRP